MNESSNFDYAAFLDALASVSLKLFSKGCFSNFQKIKVMQDNQDDQGNQDD